MQAELRQHGQMVALDPLWPDRATVGGIIAANDSGALRLKFGGLRDLIIGMTIVLADGTHRQDRRQGGQECRRLRPAQVDDRQLRHAGRDRRSEFPPAPGRRARSDLDCGCAPRSASRRRFLPRRSAPLMDSQMTPSCVQLRVSKQECALDIRIAALPECLNEYAARIQSICRKDCSRLNQAKTSGKARQQLFDRDDAIVLKVSLLPGEICAVSSVLQQWAAAEVWTSPSWPRRQA